MIKAAAASIALLALSCVACRTGANGTRSEALPHVPVYPGAQLRETVQGPERDPTEFYVVRGATQDEVLAWYRERMPKAGWTASTDAQDAFVIYHTAEGCYGFVAAYANPDGTVDLQLSEQNPDTECEPYETGIAGDD